MTSNFLKLIRPLSISPILGVALTLSQLQLAQAHSREDRLTAIDQSVGICLLKASRPGFPYYDRPEAAEACKETKNLLQNLAIHANRNRNHGCSSRATRLNFDLWKIQFLGTSRMEDQTLSAMEILRRSCYNL